MQIRAVKTEDKDFWYTLDRHLPEKEFDRKIRDKMGYVICEGETPVGILRYHLFWDNTPFLAMLFVDWQYQKKGYGRALMEFWEEEMPSRVMACCWCRRRWMKMHSTFIENLVIKIVAGYWWMFPAMSSRWRCLW